MNLKPTLVLLIRLGLFAIACVLGLLALSQSNLALIAGAIVFVALAFGLPLKALPVVSDDGSAMGVNAPQAAPISINEIVRSNRAGALTFLSIALISVSALTTFMPALWVPSLILWLAGMAVFLFAAVTHDRARSQPIPLRQRMTRGAWLEIGFVVALTLVAFALRAYDLKDFPPFMHVDEGTQGTFSLQVLAGIIPVGSFASLNTPFHIPMLAILGQAANIAIFGPNETGLRMLAAVAGTACVPAVYFMARQGWGKIAAVVAAVAIAFNNLHVHFSKLGATNIETAVWILIVILCLWLAHDRADATRPRPLALFAVAGLAMGVAQFFYFSARLIPVVVAPLLLVFLLRRKVGVLQLAALVGGTLIAFAPLAAQYTRDPDAFIGRAQSVTIFNDNIARHTLGREPKFPDDVSLLLTTQTQKMIEFFVQRGDSSSFYTSEIAPFDAITVLLAWIGFGIALTRPFRLQELTLLIWLVTGTFFGGVLTVDPPSGARMLAVTPVVFLFAGSAVARAFQLLRAFIGPTLALLAGPVVALAVILIAVTNFDTYFNRYAKMELFATGVKVARELDVDPTVFTGYVIGDTNLVGSGPTRYLANGVKIEPLESADKLPALAPGRGFVVVATSPRTGEVDKIMARYPNGDRFAYTSPQGQLMYVRYRIDPAR